MLVVVVVGSGVGGGSGSCRVTAPSRNFILLLFFFFCSLALGDEQLIGITATELAIGVRDDQTLIVQLH